MSTAVAHSRFSAEDVERGLQALALCNGNSRIAAARLSEQGLQLDHKTLWRWANVQYSDRYLEVTERELKPIQERIARQNEEISERLAEVEMASADRLITEIPDLPAKELSLVLRNASTAKGINQQNARLYRDQPTVIRKDVGGADEVLKRIAKRYGFDVDSDVDGEAEVVDEVPAVSPQRHS